MADGITLNSTSGGATVATDDISGTHYPYSKVVFGADGTATLVTASVGLPVGDAGGSLTVDGTVAATQSGTWNVGTVTTVSAVTSITNTVTVTGTGGTFPVTDSGGSLTVDAPVGTPVFVRLSDGSSAISTLAVSLASVPSHDVTNAGTFAVQAAQSGTWNVTNVSGTVSLPTGAATAAKQPALGTAGSASADVITIQGVASMTAVQVSQSGTWTVQPGNTANTTPWLVNDRPATSGGLSMHKRISTASTNAVNVKSSAGQVYSVQVMNNTSSAKYLKLYNTSSAPTVGSDTPTKVLLVPGNTGGAGLVINWDKGLAFGTGISFATTTGIADSDTGAVGANELTVNIDYQ